MENKLKLGIFFSKCEGAINKFIDLESLSREYERYTAARIFESFYDLTDFNRLLKEVEENELNALVLAGDSHYEYRRTRNGSHLFDCLAELGVNRNRIETINLKSILAVTRRAMRQELQMKAGLLIDVGIEKVKCSTDLNTLEITPRQSVAVVGNNIGSIALIQHLLDEGYKVYLIHREETFAFSAEELHEIHPTLVYVVRHPRFTVLNETRVIDFHGFTGDYILKYQTGEKTGELRVGAVVLSPDEDVKQIKGFQTIFHLDVDEAGLLISRDEVSAYFQTMDRGIFVITPRSGEHGNAPERFLVAEAVAARVINLLNRKEIYQHITVSKVDEQLCGACGVCVKTCVFNAVSLRGDPLVSVIDPRRCKGCGNCVTACPAGARDLHVCPTSFLFRSVDILSEFHRMAGVPIMLMPACDGCGYRSLDMAAESGLSLPLGVMPLWVVCGGQIDTQLLMYAFARGFGEVAMVVCSKGHCRNLVGSTALEKRVNLFREILAGRGVDSRRLHVISAVPRKVEALFEEINKIYSRLDNEKRFVKTLLAER